MHELAETMYWAVPAAQDVQVDSDVAPTALEYVPIAHDVQNVAPVPVENVPAGQLKQEDALSEEYMPVGQLRQAAGDVAALNEEYKPAVQLKQLHDDVAPSPVEKVPASQPMHVVAPLMLEYLPS